MSLSVGMSFSIAAIILATALAYALVGFFVALSFLLFGLDRIDPAARTSYVFRALLFPGLVLLWPAVILRWGRAGAFDGCKPAPVARHVNVHGLAWVCLFALIPALLCFAVLQARTPLIDTTSTRQDGRL